MTEYQIKNFDDTSIHLWVPEFTKDANDWDKVWITFCYAVAINGGIKNRYEFHLHDYGLMTPNSLIDKQQTIANFNNKFGKYIKMWYKDGNEASFSIIKKEWDFIEVMIPAGSVQRKWIHLYSQIFDHNGFKHDIFTIEEGVWKGLARRVAWSSVTQEDAWWMSNEEHHRWLNRMQPTNGRPQYLVSPLRKEGKIVKSYQGAPLKNTATLKHKDE